MTARTTVILTNIDRLSGGLHVMLKFYGIRGGRQSLIYVKKWTRWWFKMTLKPPQSQYIHQKVKNFAWCIPYPILNAIY